MMREIAVRMPKFSMAQEEGTLVSWVKRDSEEVSAGDVICEVATDKVDMEVEAPVSGRITRLIVAEDQTVAVGAPIAYIATDSAELLEGLLDGGPSAGQPVSAGRSADGADGGNSGSRDSGNAESQEGPQIPASPANPQAPGRGSRALPGARRRAAELSLSLDAINGTGPGGAVTMSDVEKASARPVAQAGQEHHASAAAAAVPPQPARLPAAAGSASLAGGADPGYASLLAELKARRQSVIAGAVAMSTAIPQFTMYATLDLELAAREQPGRGWSTLLTRVLAAALRLSPALNVTWRDDRLEPVTRIGVAIAVDTPIGLLAPVIFDPDQTDPSILDDQVVEVTDAARDGRLVSADLDGATVVLSDLGAFGVDVFQVPLTLPVVATLAVGTIARRPVAAGDGLTTRTTCEVGLTVDHRAVDVLDAARFLRRLRAIAANPDRLRNCAR